MKAIFKKLTNRTFISNFKQFVSVILIVFLASMLLSGLVTNYTTLDSVVDTYLEKTNLADAWFYVDSFSSEDEQFFIDSKINFDKRYYFETRMDIPESSVSNNGKIYIYNGKISNPYIESGVRYCLIDKKVAEDNKLKIGFDEVEIDFNFPYNGELYEINLSFIITGTMCLDECADVSSSWPVLIDKSLFINEVDTKMKSLINTTETVIDDVPYNQILVKTSKNNDENNDVDDIIARVENYYNTNSSNKLLYTFKQENIESLVILNGEINQSKKMIYVFPVIFLFVSILIILTTIDQLVMQERQKIGTLKSIGIPNKKIRNHYSKFGAILCFIGSVLGSLFGIMIIPPIMFIKYNAIYSLPNDYMNLKVQYHWIALIIIGITLLGYIVALIACQNVMRKKPIECLKFQVNNSKAFSSKKKKNNLINKLPFSLKMAVRNIKLKPARTFMAIIGIAGCFALLLCGFGIGDTLKRSVSYDYGKNFKYDIVTTYNNSDFEEILKDDSDIKNYEKFNKMYVNVKSEIYQKGINLYRIDENSSMTQINLSKNDVFITKSIAKEFGVKVGDLLQVSLGDITLNLTISKVGETSILNGIYVCDDYGFDEIYIINGMWLKCDNVTTDKIDYINSINGTNTASTLIDSIDDIEMKISSISVMTSTLKIFAVALAIVVLLNLVFLISKERVKEIATLKVIGKNIFSIVLSLFFEILFMALIGSFLGMFLGFPLLSAVLEINKVGILNYIFHISFLSFFFAYLIVTLTVVLIIGICYIKVKNINMIESLKSME